MTYIRSAVVLLRHIYRIWRAGQVRFRLETFGLYYPARPYSAPWWQTPVGNLALLLRQGRSYSRWVLEMDALGHTGAAGWWYQHYPRWKDRRDEWRGEPDESC